MSRLEKIVIRGDEPQGLREWGAHAWGTVKEATRSLWLGPYKTKDPALARLFGGGPVAAGVNVNEQTALAVSAFYSGVTLISDDLASLPLVLLRRLRGGGKEALPGHPLYELIHSAPNPEMTSAVWRQVWVMSALAFGTGYCEIERDQADRPVGLWPLDHHRVTPFRENRQLLYRVAGYNTPDVELHPRDVLVLKGPTLNGITGFDTIYQARQALGLAIAGEQFAGSFFKNGSQLGGALTVDQVLGDKARKSLLDAIESRHRGSDKAHGLLLLEAGMKYQEMGVHPRDAQFAELREFQLREVARFLKVPVAFLGDLSRSTFSNFEQMKLQYFTNCLTPWIVKIEQELSAKLINRLERHTQLIEHRTQGFLRADHEQRSQYYATMVAHGLMTANEVRELENLPPIDGGDKARAPLNTGPIAASNQGEAA